MKIVLKFVVTGCPLNAVSLLYCIIIWPKKENIINKQLSWPKCYIEFIDKFVAQEQNYERWFELIDCEIVSY